MALDNNYHFKETNTSKNFLISNVFDLAVVHGDDNQIITT